MSLHHTRTLQWRGEDLGSGTGNVKERILTATVNATAAPLAISPTFYGSTTYISNFLGTAYTPVLSGFNRFLTNQNSVYFFTMTAQLDGPAGVVLTFPIAPLQTIFLPANLTGLQAQLVADSAFPVPVPVGTTAAPAMIAGAANPLMYDLNLET